MTVFWRKRLVPGDQENQWTLSFADLMSLLLAVFVMIAAMIDWEGPHEFRRVSDGIRRAFGASISPMPVSTEEGIRPEERLARRLNSPGRHMQAVLGLEGNGGDRPCEVIAEPGRVIIRLPTQRFFAGSTAVLRPEGAQALVRLGEYLWEDQGRLSVRLRSQPGTVTGSTVFRDGWDLGYERARNVISRMTAGGIRPERFEAVRVEAGEDGVFDVVVTFPGGESPS